MSRLPKPPAEIPADRSLDQLAPVFRAKLERVLLAMAGRGQPAKIAETLRSNERAAYLHGFGRDYDDGRGIVTNATDATHTWHHYGVAADVVHVSLEWDAPDEFWEALKECALAEGLASGMCWHFVDKPHVQLGPPMREGPSIEAEHLLTTGGLSAVWRAVGGL